MLGRPLLYSTSTLLLGLIPSTSASSIDSVTRYANDFVDPDYIVSRAWNSSTEAAQQTIVNWAEDSISAGPWSVTKKPATPPSGDIHDYMSWAPYSWPDCSNVHNTTELSPQQIWTECNYYTRDGVFNPDYRLLTDSQSFQNLSDAVLYNVLAYVLKNDTKYSKAAVNLIQTWFIDDATKMNPNLKYAQLARGPQGQVGQHLGVLDLHCMPKIVSGVLILRKLHAAEWTSDLDSKLVAWSKQYVTWLTTDPMALGERNATNNHGSFYFNQVAALQILVGDNDGAKDTLNAYFKGIYLDQINADGEQPLEAWRTRPYHYRAYNLAAMITNARLLAYVDPSNAASAWIIPSKSGGTIQKALDFAMSVKPMANETDAASEMYPNIGAVAAHFGDGGSGKYTQFVAEGESTYPGEAWFLWNQPFWDSGVKVTVPDNGNSSASGSTAQAKPNAALSLTPFVGASFVLSIVVGTVLG